MKIEELIALPYPNKTEKSRGISIFAHCDNFFRNTPVRKITVIHNETGDHDYDEDMTEDKEIEISIENQKIYKETQTLLLDALKAYPFQESVYPSDLDTASNYDDELKEDTTLEGEDFCWTQEYEGGIHSFDNELNTIWDLGKEYLYLGCGADFGDGNFSYCTFVCITPKTKVVSDFEPQEHLTVEAGFYFDTEKSAYIFSKSRDEVYKPEQVTFCRLNTAGDMKILPAEFLQAKNIDTLHFEFSNQLEIFPDFSSLKNLQEIEIRSFDFFGSYEEAIPERVKEMIQIVIPSVNTLIIRKFKKLPLSFLQEITKWKGLRTLVFYETDIIFNDKDFKAFIDEINVSNIETIKIPGTGKLLYLEDETKELEDYLPTKKVIMNY
jgi:hypothetical protein